MLSSHEYTRGARAAALFVLRMCLTAQILIEAERQHLFATPSVITILLGGIAVGLCLGILTSTCGILALIGGVSLLATGHVIATEFGLLTLLLCPVVSILGPGVYSLDCALFGRRKIVLETRKH